jgi:hypothetical protein
MSQSDVNIYLSAGLVKVMLSTYYANLADVIQPTQRNTLITSVVMVHEYCSPIGSQGFFPDPGSDRYAKSNLIPSASSLNFSCLNYLYSDTSCPGYL